MSNQVYVKRWKCAKLCNFYYSASSDHSECDIITKTPSGRSTLLRSAGQFNLRVSTVFKWWLTSYLLIVCKYKKLAKLITAPPSVYIIIGPWHTSHNANDVLPSNKVFEKKEASTICTQCGFLWRFYKYSILMIGHLGETLLFRPLKRKRRKL